MPDLVTHAASGYLLSQIVPRARPSLVIAGSFAPDLLCRVPALIFTVINTRVVRVPSVLMYGWEPLHTPVGLVLSAYMLAHLFRQDVRARAFANLLGGMFLHLGLDLLQDHYGVGNALFFPLSFGSYELGWIGSEDSVYAVPVLVVLSIALWWWKRRSS